MHTSQDKPSRSHHLTADEIDASQAAIQHVFRQCRPLILQHAGKSEYTDKQDGSPVTETDVEVEKTVQAALTQHFPDLPVLGEETGYSDDLPDPCWLIDPIDGTKSFIANIPTFTSMAVLIQGGEAIACVIYNISSDDLYTAQKHKGAYRNGERLDLRTVPLPPTALSKGRFTDTLNDILKPKNVVSESGPSGAGYGFAMVADGTVAARFNLLGAGYVHDYAPGALLVQEAGGALLPVKDAHYTYKTRSFIACHPELTSILASHIAVIRDLEARG